MSADNSSQFNRTAIIVALGLAIVLVIGVLLGARVVSDQAASQPVQLGELPGGNPDHPACAPLIDELPEEAAGLDRAEIQEPVPAGAAVWTGGEADELTLRCGVELPFQYTSLSETTEAEDTEWLHVKDPTTDSLQTWYTVDRSPAIALTLYQVDAEVTTEDLAADLGAAISSVPGTEPEPRDTPLADMAPAAADATERCTALMDNLPESFGNDPEYTRASIADTGLPADTDAAWTAPGHEPVVLRCGVAPPENYEAGAMLNQVNEVPWFEDTTLANGTTSSTWFALGRDIDIAVNVPQASGNAAVVSLGEAIVEHTDEQ